MTRPAYHEYGHRVPRDLIALMCGLPNALCELAHPVGWDTVSGAARRELFAKDR